MSQPAFPTKWKYVVEFLDDETQQISGTIGQAATCDECEGLIEDEVDVLPSSGRTLVNAEAYQVCAHCDGQGKIETPDGAHAICYTCRGEVGPVSTLSFLELKEVKVSVCTFLRAGLLESAAL
jgi:hypothetical protein